MWTTNCGRAAVDILQCIAITVFDAGTFTTTRSAFFLELSLMASALWWKCECETAKLLPHYASSTIVSVVISVWGTEEHDTSGTIYDASSHGSPTASTRFCWRIWVCRYRRLRLKGNVRISSIGLGCTG